MKFFTAATTALLFSAQALAGITSYTLSIKSDDERVNGKGITKHEGAGINYAFVSDTSSKFAYDDESKLLYYPASPQLKYNFGTEADIIQFSVTPPKSVEIGEDGVLKFEDSDKLYAAVVSTTHTITLIVILLLFSEVNHMLFQFKLLLKKLK